MVTMWQGRVRLMWSIMVARVVVLPDPVPPEMVSCDRFEAREAPEST